MDWCMSRSDESWGMVTFILSYNPRPVRSRTDLCRCLMCVVTSLPPHLTSSSSVGISKSSCALDWIVHLFLKKMVLARTFVTLCSRTINTGKCMCSFPKEWYKLGPWTKASFFQTIHASWMIHALNNFPILCRALPSTLLFPPLQILSFEVCSLKRLIDFL